jgi:predicted signal transduction protein with EAL and GGDEF domain
MVNHRCEPICQSWFESCRTSRALQGGGAAPLTVYRRHPIARIKIDQSFVRKISSRTDNTAIVRSIIVMAHNLSLEVIAEGVETPAQADFLKAEGCDEVQGFLYAKPLTDAEFRGFLLANQVGIPKRESEKSDFVKTKGRNLRAS